MHASVIFILNKLRQEDFKFETGLGYTTNSVSKQKQWLRHSSLETTDLKIGIGRDKFCSVASGNCN